MNISVVVIAYNEERNIAECLDSLIKQTYTMGEYEIIVVDGESRDRTPDIVKEYAARHPRVRFVNNPGRTESSNRNVGVRRAMHPYIAFTDADCVCPEHWLERLAQGYASCLAADPNVGGVGGGNVSDERFGPVSKAIGLAFDTPFSALGSQQTRIWDRTKQVESLAMLNVLYPKSLFEEVGYLDESQTCSGEDWIFNYHARRLGYRFYFLADATVLHKMRTTVPAFARQMYRYGVGRGVIIRKHPRTLTVRYAAPVLFLALMLASAAAAAAAGQPALLTPLLAYILFFAAYSFLLCAAKASVRCAPLVFGVFLIIHFGYSLGETAALLRRK
ncbi:MAG TPA: glycosyltransferase [Paenibacillus sp.]|nr:glycosyltransferase [Paenibacillus sp.]